MTTHDEAIGRRVLMWLLDAQPMGFREIQEALEQDAEDGALEDEVTAVAAADALLGLMHRGWVQARYTLTADGSETAHRVAAAERAERDAEVPW